MVRDLKGPIKPGPRRKKQTLTVYLFNVGQGDHLLLEMPDGKFGLIDFHYDGNINLALEPPALTYLKHIHKPKKPIVISFICISHPDRDHTKGVDKVLQWIERENIEVERFWLYAGIDAKDLKRALEQAVSSLKMIVRKRVQLKPTATGPRNTSQILQLSDDLVKIGEFIERWERKTNRRADYLQGINRLDHLAGVEVCTIAPLGSDVKKANSRILIDVFQWLQRQTAIALHDTNLVSSVIKMKFYKHQLLFGGDAGEEVWQACLDEFERKHQNHQGPCASSYRGNFIKISHHGSKNSSSVSLWERIMDEEAIIGISAGKGYKHPHNETIAHIREAEKNRNVSPQVVTTNACDRCQMSLGLPTQDLSWLPQTPSAPRKKRTNQALDMVKPPSGKGIRDHQPTSPIVNKALGTVTPKSEVKSKSRLSKLLAAFVFRFNSSSKDIHVSKAVAASLKQRDCIYGYKSEKYFPECASTEHKIGKVFR